MPYNSVVDLPADVRKRYSHHCQRQFMHVFNSVMERQQNEKMAFAEAHAVANRCMEAEKAK